MGDLGQRGCGVASDCEAPSVEDYNYDGVSGGFGESRWGRKRGK